MDKIINSLNTNVLNYLNSFNKNSFDIVFVDALQQDFKLILDLLIGNKVIKKSSWVIFDNVDSHNSMSGLENYLKKENFELIHLGADSGFLIAEF